MNEKQTRRQFLRHAGSLGTTAAAFSILSRSASGASDRPPNILLFFPDQHRPDWTSIDAGVGVRTPNLVKLAQNGTRFTNALCPSPLCAPSRACLARGREYNRTGVPANSYNLPDGVPTIYSLLRDAGYRVGSLGKADLRKKDFDWGLDGLHQVGDRTIFREWGFTDGFDSEGKQATLKRVDNKETPEKAVGQAPYTRMLSDRRDGSLERYLRWFEASKSAYNSWAHTEPMDIPDEAYNDNWVGQNSVKVIQDFPNDQPWFLQVNFPGPHPPEDITPGMAEWYKTIALPEAHRNTQLPPEKHREIRRNYSAMVENIDQWLGRFVTAIEARGELENTIIVWSSDHGEMLGDHDLWGKCHPHHPSASVPLIVAGPGVRKGHVFSGAATTLDLSATFLDYAGVARPDDFDSQTLRPLLEGRTETGRAHVLTGVQKWRAVYDGRHKFIVGYDLKGAQEEGDTGRDADAPPLLFDLAQDPKEDHNIAAENPELAKRFAEILARAKEREIVA